MNLNIQQITEEMHKKSNEHFTSSLPVSDEKMLSAWEFEWDKMRDWELVDELVPGVFEQHSTLKTEKTMQETIARFHVRRSIRQFVQNEKHKVMAKLLKSGGAQ